MAADRKAYFGAGLRILAHDGVRGLTVSALCGEMVVTKGSFYHHFTGTADYVAALLEYWEHEHSALPISRSVAELDPLDRQRQLIDIAVALPHRAEAALRGWANSDDAVAQVLARVDARREQHLIDSNLALGLSERDATLSAATAMAVLIGAQQRHREVDVELMRAMLGQLLTLIRRSARAVVEGT